MDPPAPDPTVEPPPLAIKKQNLMPEERRNIVTSLLLVVKPDDPDMKLPRGAIKSSADTHNVTRWTINRIWERALANYRNPNIRAFRSSPQKIRSSTEVESRRRSQRCQRAPTTSSEEDHSKYRYYRAGDSKIVIVQDEERQAEHSCWCT